MPPARVEGNVERRIGLSRHREHGLSVHAELGFLGDEPQAVEVGIRAGSHRDQRLATHFMAADPRFRAIRVEGSESKAQNVNAALSETTGEFIGIFDADHHPEPNGFRRAWRWLDSGYDIVQGHCAVRNGDETWVSRMVAVEFEAIYAVSHPGRARLHHFGIFGGSNGYWKAHLLHAIRMVAASRPTHS